MKSYYKNNEHEIPIYEEKQIKRHKYKKYKKRNRSEYDICSDRLKSAFEVKQDHKMICLGTRNNHERDIFRENLEIEVCSQDIALSAYADYTGDFGELSSFVPHDWDIIYSNSLDHALDPIAALSEWTAVLKDGGVMILGFDFDITEPGRFDCNSFTEDDVNNLIKGMSVLDRFSATYNYWIVKK